MNKLVSFAAVAAVSLGVAPAFAADVTLRMSNWFPTSFFPYDQVVVPWAENVEKVTEGRVKVDNREIDGVFEGVIQAFLAVTGLLDGKTAVSQLGRQGLPQSDIILDKQ